MTNSLPNSGYLGLSQIIGNPKADPPLRPIIPVSRSTWWAGVKDGRLPQPVKLGPRTPLLISLFSTTRPNSLALPTVAATAALA